MATMKDVKEFFGMTMAEFKAEWSPLSAEDKAEFLAMLDALK